MCMSLDEFFFCEYKAEHYVTLCSQGKDIPFLSYGNQSEIFYTVM